MREKLAAELLDASNNTGAAVVPVHEQVRSLHDDPVLGAAALGIGGSGGNGGSGGLGKH